VEDHASKHHLWVAASKDGSEQPGASVGRILRGTSAHHPGGLTEGTVITLEAMGHPGEITGGGPVSLCLCSVAWTCASAPI
jgi:hypothetical protein